MSVPALSWDAILNMTRVELDLISDVDMFLFFGEEMRAGVPCISRSYSKANTKCLTSYDLKKPTKYITYLDKNTVYNYDMSKSLDKRVFKWLDAR